MSFDRKLLNPSGFKKLGNIDAREYSAKTFTSINNTMVLKTDKIPLFPELKFENLSSDENINLSLNEIKNSKVLYDSISREMNWIKIVNPFLWTYVCHTKYFDYTKDRICWRKKNTVQIFNKDLLNYKKLDEKNKKDIDTKINRFFTNNSFRSLTLNHVSRLYIAAEVTYNCWERFPNIIELKQKNPYFFTEILLSSQDLYMSIVQRNNVLSKYPSILNLILFYLNKKDPKKRKSRAFYRKFIKAIVCDLVVNPLYVNSSFEETIKYFDQMVIDLNI
ncbi:DUF6339 family protein [Candidatus Marinimicrobia bacterium]|nr:DUF6339 family protein [Candidatus Neomarinimicrobiota bacterium]